MQWTRALALPVLGLVSAPAFGCGAGDDTANAGLDSSASYDATDAAYTTDAADSDETTETTDAGSDVGCTRVDVGDATTDGPVGGCEGDAGCSAPGPGGRRLLRAPASWGLPLDAVPTDASADDGRMLLSSYSTGLLEIEWARTESAPRIVRTWPKPAGGIFGVARYGACGVVYAAVYGRGLLVIRGDDQTWITPDDGLVNKDLLDILVRKNGDVWVAGVPEPFGLHTGRVQALRDGRVVWTTEGDWQIARWIDVPERDSVFAAVGRVGIVEFAGDGKATILEDSDTYPATVVRQPGTSTIAAFGDQLFAWDGTRFDLVTLTGTRPTVPPSTTSSSDLVIDDDGNWLLHNTPGYVLVADAAHAMLGAFDSSSGLPSSASRLFVQPNSGRVFAASTEGLSVLIP